MRAARFRRVVVGVVLQAVLQIDAASKGLGASASSPLEPRFMYEKDPVDPMKMREEIKLLGRI